MGYRSEVAIALRDDAVRLLAAVMEHESDLKGMIESAQSTINESEDDKGGRLYWDYIKWFDDYKGVAALDLILCTIPDEDFHFIRIGEENSDVEEHGHFCSDMHIQRSIVW